MHIVFIAFTIWEMTGGRSSDLYSPFFETDVRNCEDPKHYTFHESPLSAVETC